MKNKCLNNLGEELNKDLGPDIIYNENQLSSYLNTILEQNQLQNFKIFEQYLGQEKCLILLNNNFFNDLLKLGSEKIKKILFFLKRNNFDFKTFESILSVDFVNFILFTEEDFIKKINLFDQNTKKFFNFIKNPDFQFIVKYIKKDNFNLLIKKYDIYEIVNDKTKIEHYKKALKNNSFEVFEEIYDIKFEKGYSINIKNTKNTIDSCLNNEIYNSEILSGGELYDIYYLKILLGNKIIGIIKGAGEPSFLAFEDIFDNNGILIFKKEWIYNLEYFGTTLENTEFWEKGELNLLEITDGLARNPIRKIIKEHDPVLYDNFTKLVKNFIIKVNQN